MTTNLAFGIDIGGSGVKGAPVNLTTGELTSGRLRFPTPKPSTPEAVAITAAEIIKSFSWTGSVGFGFPAVVQHGVTKTAANMDDSWIDAHAAEIFTKVTGKKAIVINDADAAGLAEITYGAGKGQPGVIIIVTIGTGLGTSLFINGILVPNSELGHIKIKCKDAELKASDAARKRNNLSWKRWGKNFNTYLSTLEALLWPDLIILGGGGSSKLHRFQAHLDIKTKIVPAQLLNDAGIIGAAFASTL